MKIIKCKSTNNINRLSSLTRRIQSHIMYILSPTLPQQSRKMTIQNHHAYMLCSIKLVKKGQGRPICQFATHYLKKPHPIYPFNPSRVCYRMSLCRHYWSLGLGFRSIYVFLFWSLWQRTFIFWNNRVYLCDLNHLV